MDNIIGIIGVILSAIALMGLVTLPKHFHDQRLEKYNEMRKMISERPYQIRKNISEQWADAGFPYLLHKKEWNHEAGQPLKLIDNVAILADNGVYNYSKLKKYVSRHVILPEKRKSITDNLLLFSDGVLYDAPTYGISKIENDKGQLILHVKRGTYFDFVNTCFGYGYEAAYDSITSKCKFALRHKYPIINFDYRFPLIGIVTLIILKNVGTSNDKQNYCLIHERGNDVSESQGLINAIPGATFQPSKATAQMELTPALTTETLKHTVIREFLEEIFGVEEFSELTEPAYLENTDAWKVLKGSVYYLGCGLNPINTYLEVLACAVIDMDKPEPKKLFGISRKEDPTISLIAKKIVGNFEGNIKQKPFSKETLKYYEKAHLSAPALSQICKVILEDWDTIVKQFGID